MVLYSALNNKKKGLAMAQDSTDSFCPLNREEWRSWLEDNHIEKNYIWLIIYKQSSATPTITWSEAVDEAICFGWIDSTKRSIDSEKYMQYFTKRKAKSNWSKINKKKVANLLKEGRISKAGLQSIEVAKQNGSWTLLDDVEELIVPPILEQEFARNKGTKEYFLNLSKSTKKSLLYWIISAKRELTKQKRVAELINNALQNNIPKQFR